MRGVLPKVLLVLACGFLGVGAALLWKGVARPGRDAALLGGILLVALLCERWRYRHIEHPPAGAWQRTGERFEDPETGRIVEVLYDPKTGERRYAPVSGPSSPGK